MAKSNSRRSDRERLDRAGDSRTERLLRIANGLTELRQLVECGCPLPLSMELAKVAKTRQY